MYKVEWVAEGKECSKECSGYGGARITAKTLEEEGIQDISIWRLETVLCSSEGDNENN